MNEHIAIEAPRLEVPNRELSKARMKVGRAAWASRSYRDFSRQSVLKIADAIAEAGFARAKNLLLMQLRRLAMVWWSIRL